MGNRQCAVQINNNTDNYMLRNPIVYLYHGRYQEALPSTIAPSENGSALFTKTPNTACGDVGVFTYDLYNESRNRDEKKMAVMFSNPYNFNFYSNLYAVGLFDRNELVDESLYDKMYYKTGTEFVRNHAGSDLIYKGNGLIISATMTDSYQPQLDVNVISSING